ncbi:cytochrome c-type biogenesis protein CcmH [Parvibaculum indicum]|uniref:cytochrome c-type biogenesis protein n=1 Tax=Parvibaculum indicum TaxID=562969 RepID=UPI0014225493|nr:cytochrome c-type biogenesis protein [Parvibaculum indicum]NIJ41922.1 cytochrome c-type biogenesis protein CcmH [Parvibaculum indicum]
MKLSAFLFALLFALTPATAFAVISPDEKLSDPGLEARAREVSKELRCLVCQNESIDDSDAELAKDLRMLVRKRILAGDTNEEVKQYLVARYGEFVLMRPPFQPATWLLWLGPGAILLGGAVGIVLFLRRSSRRDENATGNPALSEAERRRLDEIVKNDPPE